MDIQIVIYLCTLIVHLYTVYGQVADYTNLGLTAIPSDIQPNVGTLLLNYNKLTSIEDNAFSNLHNLTTLQLNNNLISHIHPNALNNLCLSHLHLGYNPLTSLQDLSFMGGSLIYLGVRDTKITFIPDFHPTNMAALTINAQRSPLDLCTCENVWLKQAEKDGATVVVRDTSNTCWQDAGHQQLKLQCTIGK